MACSKTRDTSNDDCTSIEQYDYTERVYVLGQRTINVVIDRRRPLVVHVIFRLDIGGLENGLINLINGLPDTDFRHAIVCIDEFTDYRERILRDDVEIVAICKRPGTDISALSRLYGVFRRLRPAIVHTRNLGALDALLPAFLAGVRSRIHGEHGWDVNDLDGNNQKLRLLRRLHAPLIHHYIALSKHLEQYLIEKIGINAGRVTQLYNGVDTSRFRPSTQNTADQRQLKPSFGSNTVSIGTVGRLNAVKDPLNLVDAFVHMIKRKPRLAETARLVVVGDGPLRRSVICRLDEVSMTEIAWIPGARDDVPQILRSFDLFVLPSLAEGISNTILEAMATELPVVATNVGGNPELVADGKTGMLVAPNSPVAMADAMEKYISNSEIRHLHGMAGRRRARNTFGLDVMLKAYRDLYRSFAN